VACLDLDGEFEVGFAVAGLVAEEVETFLVERPTQVVEMTAAARTGRRLAAGVLAHLQIQILSKATSI
jgi:hypothetical protein